MLSQTKENLMSILEKLKVLEFTMESLKVTHKDDAELVERLFREASAHKLKLIEEVHRLSI